MEKSFASEPSPPTRAKRMWLAIGLLMLVGAAVRAPHLGEPGIVPDRQYRSYLIARAYFLDASDEAPEWRKKVASASSQRQEPLEPQLTELIVASIYRLIGRETPQVAKVTSSLFWLLGVIPLFFIALRLGSPASGVFAATYYLLVPAGILTSLSFLPEPLMILALLCSVLAILNFWDRPSTLRLTLAAAVSSLAILIKPLDVFVIFGAFTALAIYNSSLKRFVDRRFLVFTMLALVPSVLFYGKGIFLDDYLRWKLDVGFLPHLFLSREFYEGWLRLGTRTVGLIPLLIALVGLPLNRRLGAHLLLGLWCGYFVFCLFFNYFIYFAGYYHTQAIVIVALSLGPPLTLLADRLWLSRLKWYGWAPVIGAVLLALPYNWREVKRGQEYPWFVGESVAAEIGDIVSHSDRVAYLAGAYGLPLEYYGELAGEYWPRPVRSWPLWRPGEQPLGIEERVEALGFVPEYFVITDFNEYDRKHSDLKSFLETRCNLVAQNEHYLIYAVPETIWNP